MDFITDPTIEFWLVWFITLFVMFLSGYRAGRHGACPHPVFWGSKDCVWKRKTLVVNEATLDTIETVAEATEKEQDSE